MAAAALLTFLIADVRGYTRFTREHGDQAAARLAQRFADLARDAVEARSGRLVELRGDEAMAVFASPRQALFAAAELIAACSEEAEADSTLPLSVGAGVATGEAVPVEGGYRGMALNTAARLCSQAAGGEVLLPASQADADGDVALIRFEPRGSVELKGFETPLELVRALVDVGALAPTRPRDRELLPPELEPGFTIAGRQRELAWLRGTWRQARRGRGRLLVVSGPPGIGKTAVAGAAAELVLADGGRVLYAGAGGAAAALASAKLDEALAAPEPALVVLDDFDALEDALGPRLEELAETVRTSATIVLVLVRDPDSSPALAALVERLDRYGDVQRPLEPLGFADVHEIAAVYAGDDVDSAPVESVARASGGVPARVHELLTDWAEQEAVRRMEAAAEWLAAERDDYRAGLDFANNVIGLKLARLYGTTTAASETPALECPYKGLASFEAQDAGSFFGRERLVGELAARTVGAGLLGVVGASGSGKSSVLAAGLVPSLEAGLLPGSGLWRAVTIRPGEHPCNELAGVDADVRGSRLVLVVDQFEETFSLCGDEEERAAFVDRLVELAGDPERVVVVLGLRGDYYGHCAAFPNLARLLAENHVLVGPMSRDELRRAVELPARRAGVRAEAALVSALVDEVADEPGGLPLLSTALVELWSSRSDGWLRLAEHERLGGVRGAVARLAERSYEQFDSEQRAAARLLFLRLVVTGEDGVQARRRVDVSELDLSTDPVMAATVRRLVDDRLLTAGTGTVEVAHEALLREWPRLQEWLREDAQGRELREHLMQSARRWDAAGRDPGELYRGTRLSATLDWSVGREHELNELEREFLAAGRAETDRELVRQRRQNRRLKGLLAGVGVFLLAAVAAGALALVSRNDAQASATAATAQRLGAQALTVKDGDLSLLLAREGVRVHDSSETLGNLESALTRAPDAIRFSRPLPGRLLVAAASPDGRHVVYANNGGQIAITDAATGRVVRTVDADGWDFVPGSDDLFVARGFPEMEHLRLDPVTGDERFVVRGTVPPDTVAFTFGSTPRTALFLHESGDVTIRDFRRGTVRSTIPAVPGVLRVDVRAGGGRLVVVGSREADPFAGRGHYEVWTLRPLRRIATVDDAEGVPVHALDDEGRLLAVGRADATVAVHDLRTGQSRVLGGRLRTGAQSLVFSDDGSLLAATDGAEPQTLVWDVESGELRHDLAGHSARPNEPAFSPDNTTLYTVSHDGAAIAWDLDGTRGLARRFQAGDGNPGAQGTDASPTFAMSPDGSRIAVTQADGRLSVVDLASFRRVVRTAAAGGRLHDVAWSPDGSELATAAAGAHVVTWKASDGTPARRSFAGVPAKADALSIAYSPDGTLLAAGLGDGTVHVWDAATGDPKATLVAHGSPGGDDRILDVAFSPDGGAIAAAVASPGQAPRGVAVVWNVADGRQLYRIVNVDDGYGRASAVAFSPDGRLLATGGGTGEIKLWDATTGRQAGNSLTAVAGWVTGMQFDPSGRLLAATGDGTVRLWDVSRRAPYGSPLPGLHAEGGLGFTPDGATLVAVDAEGWGLQWPMAADAWKERACAVAGRVLTELEWQLYLPGRAYDPSC